jgi:hypothetical protein
MVYALPREIVKREKSEADVFDQWLFFGPTKAGVSIAVTHLAKAVSQFI